MTPSLSAEPERARGVLLGAAVGDALGWPQEDRNNIVGGARARDVEPQAEFRTWLRNAGTQFARYEDPVRPGEYSDDTQLLLAVARSCERGGEWRQWLTQVEIPTWSMYQRGGGRAVLAASRSWQEGRPPWSPGGNRDAERSDAYFRAGANGVAMRIAPHVLVTVTADPKHLIERIVADGITTHGHPRALVGAAIHGLALRHALAHRGTLGYGDLIYAILEDKTWRDESVLAHVAPAEWHDRFREVNRVDSASSWKATVYEVTDLLALATDALSAGAMANDERVLDEMGCFDKKRNGSGTITAAATLYVSARSAARPMSGLLRTAFLQRSDADTLASMTASLLSAVHGTAWMGSLAKTVQDAQYLSDIALRLAYPAKTDAASGSADPWPALPVGKEIGTVRSSIFDQDSTRFRMPDGRPVEILHRELLDTKSNSVVERVVGRSLDGQTLFFDKVSRGRPVEAANRPQQDTRTEVGTPSPRQERDKTATPPASTPPPEAVVAGLHLRVRDLTKSAAFYSETLGLPCKRSADQTVQVGSHIFLHQAHPDEPLGVTNRIMITLHVPNLDAIGSRLHETNYPHSDSRHDERRLSLRDLDGHPLQVLQR